MYLAVGDPLFLMMFKVLSFMLKYYLFDELSFSKSVGLVVGRFNEPCNLLF